MFERLNNFFERNKAALTGLCFLLFIVLIVGRRVDAFSNPQFWAEDGRNWFAAAYNNGLKSLFWTQDGYFQTFPRVIAYVTSKMSFQHAPLVFNLVALVVQLAAAMYILSDRLRKVIPLFSARVVLAFYFILLPNSAEAHLNLTNSQWFLAIITIMIIFAEPVITFGQKVFEYAVLILSALTGPFSIIIAPFALFEGFKSRSWARSLIISSGAIVQLLGLFVFSHRNRIDVYLGANLGALVKIFDRQILLSALIGQKGTVWLLENTTNIFLLFAVVTILGLLLSFWALLKAPRQLKLFIILSFTIFCAALYTPTIGDFTKSGWQVLYDVVDGPRYWMLPILAFFLVILWNLRKGNPLFFRVIATVLLILTPLGVWLDFKDKPFIDYNFRVEANNFNGTPTGDLYQLPINPEGWVMQLRKK